MESLAQFAAQKVAEVDTTEAVPKDPVVRKWWDTMADLGPSHHCAIGVGHMASKIEKLGLLLRLEEDRIC